MSHFVAGVCSWSLARGLSAWVRQILNGDEHRNVVFGMSYCSSMTRIAKKNILTTATAWRSMPAVVSLQRTAQLLKMKQ